MPQQSRFQRFWIGWRKDIIRGAVIFAAIVGVGLTVSNMSGNVSRQFSERGFDFGDLDLDNRNWSETFRWAGTVPAGEGVWIRNMNGPISVSPASGDSVVVTVEKSWHSSDPHSVEIVTVPHGAAVTICAMWNAQEATCGPEGSYHMKNMRGNDVAVRFHVELPRGVLLDASTVNGRLDVTDASAPVTLETVNGGIEASTAQGPVNAKTVNGSVQISMAALTSGEVTAKTVNGSITAVLPRGLDANLDAQTVSGRVNTDFPVQMVGRISSRHVKATIGAGGHPVNLRTVNGSINIQELAEAAIPPIPPVPAVAPKPARAPRAAATAVQPR